MQPTVMIVRAAMTDSDRIPGRGRWAKRVLAFCLLACWSLLAAPTARNPARADVPATRPSAASADARVRPATQPDFLVDLRKTIEYLASDELEGRKIGTPGIDLAADYIADAFGKLGLQPAPGQ